MKLFPHIYILNTKSELFLCVELVAQPVIVSDGTADVVDVVFVNM